MNTTETSDFINARLLPQLNGDGGVQLCPRCGGANTPNKRLPLQPCIHCKAPVSWVGPLWGEAL